MMPRPMRWKIKLSEVIADLSNTLIFSPLKAVEAANPESLTAFNFSGEEGFRSPLAPEVSFSIVSVLGMFGEP